MFQTNEFQEEEALKPGKYAKVRMERKMAMSGVDAFMTNNLP